MRCKCCGSADRCKLAAEVCIHFPGLSQIDKSAVFLFPELTVCVTCGIAEFLVPETELRLVAERDDDSGTVCEFIARTVSSASLSRDTTFINYMVGRTPAFWPIG